jgi:hypothetical protein
MGPEQDFKRTRGEAERRPVEDLDVTAMTEVSNEKEIATRATTR